MTRGTRGGVRAVLARWRGRDIELKTPGEIDAMRVAGERYTAQRMVQQYTTQYYVPAMRGEAVKDDPPTA